jgi:hypothetical protein
MQMHPKKCVLNEAALPQKKAPLTEGAFEKGGAFEESARDTKVHSYKERARKLENHDGYPGAD